MTVSCHTRSWRDFNSLESLEPNVYAASSRFLQSLEFIGLATAKTHKSPAFIRVLAGLAFRNLHTRERILWGGVSWQFEQAKGT